MTIHIDIATSTFIRFGLVVAAFAGAVLLLWKVQGPLTLIAISLFLALALNPPVSAIARRMPGKSRVGATAIAYLLVITLLGSLIVLIAPPFIEQSRRFAETVPQLIDDVNKQRAPLQGLIDRYGLQQEVNDALENVKQHAQSFATDLGNLLVVGATSLVNGIISLLVVLVLTFLALVEGPTWMKRIWRVYRNPVTLERHRTVVHRMYGVVTGFVNGQLLVAFIGALASLATILILSAIFPIPANLAFPIASLVLITTLIPLIGSTIGMVLGTLILLLNDVGAAITYAIYFLVYQQIENNFIGPAVQSKTVDISAWTVMAAILIGFSLFGLLGGLISIPIAGCIKVLIMDYLEHRPPRRTTKNPLRRLVAKKE